MRSLCCAMFAFLALFTVQSTFGQSSEEKIDSAAIAQIRDEGMNRSQVLETLRMLSDVYGPRLTGSPGYLRAAEWAQAKLASWKLDNSRLEAWGPFGRGWALKHYSANVIGAQVFPLISYPKAWSPSISATGALIHFDAKTDSALATYKGKLKGKFVLMGDTREIKAHFEPEATRESDSSLLKLANADLPASRRGRRFEQTAEQKARSLVDYKKWLLCQSEGALGVLTISRGDGGNIFVQQATVPSHPDTPFVKRVSVYSKKAPKILPQFAVGAEHFNRLVRMMQRGEQPKLEISLDASFTPADSAHNIIAEIPGTDLKDEVVMIGAHFDSWHGGTGATDNATGSAACMEAMRIIKTLGLAPRRTIRIGLWAGEEQGLLGSEAYVRAHFGERETATAPADPGSGALKLKPDAEKFSAYFNNDNGSGKVRGIYLQGNEAARPVFRKWLAPFADLGASTITLQNTGGTDHQSFDAIGLPGFQFIQDELEYSSRTHHSTMDLYDRVQAEDLKQASVLMAAFAYNAAMRDAKIPRKPVPQVPRTPGSN